MNNLNEIDIDELKTKGVIIGLDVGDKTIGVAVSDRNIFIASAVATVSRKYLEYDVKALLDLVKKYKIGAVVYGWPIKMDGSLSPQCEKIKIFIDAIQQQLNVEFFAYDERFSTKIVDNLMILGDMSRRKRKNVVDKLAAVYVLQGALDFLNYVAKRRK